MTIVPRTGPLSASSALASTSWYQRGKSSACAVSTFAIGDGSYRPARFLPERVAAGSGSGPRPGGTRDRPADAVEGAAVELVGHHCLLARAAVGVVVGVMGPRDLDLAAAVAVDIAVRDVGIDLDPRKPPEVEHGAAAPLDGDARRRGEPQAVVAHCARRRHLGEVDRPDVVGPGGGVAVDRRRGDRRGVGGPRRLVASGGGDERGRDRESCQHEAAVGARARRHGRRTIPEMCVSIRLRIGCDHAPLSPVVAYSRRSGGPTSTNQATTPNRARNSAMRISENTKPRNSCTTSQATRMTSSATPILPSNPCPRSAGRATPKPYRRHRSPNGRPGERSSPPLQLADQLDLLLALIDVGA